MNSYENLSTWRPLQEKKKIPFYRHWYVLVLLVLLMSGGVAAFGAYIVYIKPHIERANSAEFNMQDIIKLEAASQVFDREGKELTQLYIVNRVPIKLDQVPQHFIDALVAQEDSRFFQHTGVDYIALARAVYHNLRKKEVNQGASTITQQLTRNTFSLHEKTIHRKILECFLAHRVERHYSKKEILEHYINRIFFGRQFYGLQAAARGYFGKDAKDLLIEESAVIAGLIKSPNNIEPIRNPERAKKERNAVLMRMVEEGKLSYTEAKLLLEKPLSVNHDSADARQTYFFDEVRKQVIEILGDEGSHTGGFKIHITIDSSLQAVAESSMRKNLQKVEDLPEYAHLKYLDYRKTVSQKKTTATKPSPDYLQAAILAIDNKSGAILTLVGGRDFRDRQYNLAMDGNGRPSGPLIKPFVYAAAFDKKNITPITKLDDTPIDNRRVWIDGGTGILGEWASEEENPEWSREKITARDALVFSRNSATFRLSEMLGNNILDQITCLRETCFKAGIKSPLRDYSNTFLGTSEMRLDEICLAYSCFPNLGKRVEKLHIISKILSSRGELIYSLEQHQKPMIQALDEVTAFQVNHCLVDSLKRGIASIAFENYGLGNIYAGGKTATHYDFKDLWHAGYTSRITCGVWVGLESNKSIHPGAFSHKIALPIWTDIINQSIQRYAPEAIMPPSKAKAVEVCRSSHLPENGKCYENIKLSNGKIQSVKHTYTEYFHENFKITERCDLHRGSNDSDHFQFSDNNNTSTENSTTTESELFDNPDIFKVVSLKSPTIIGFDPYDSAKSPNKPIQKPSQPKNQEEAIPSAIPVDENGNEILTAIPVEEPPTKSQPPPSLPEQNLRRLPEPPKLRIEAD
jgi:penicillin-binding protein 1A